MELKYKCLILDHDDTAVDSTAKLHYPAHLEVMRTLRPHLSPISLEEWFLKNFHPGIMEYLVKELKFTDREMQIEYQIWRDYTLSRIPQFYPGFMEILKTFKEMGGVISVVSHSEKDLIERDYRHHNADILPDLIFGWDYDEEKRKPSPWPVWQILNQFGLKPLEALIIDDLKPGVLMSQASGVPVAAAGWSHSIPSIREFMNAHCAAYFTDIEELRDYIFG
ncbi:MAG: HAD hydrolase-like protein [Spirochaetota bacterium]